MLMTFNDIAMMAVMADRRRRKDSSKERHGVGLGFMSFFTKASVGALTAFPLLNAESQGTDIVRKFYYDIGIAVGAEGGLVVPVVRDANRKTFAQNEKGMGKLAGQASADDRFHGDEQGWPGADFGHRKKADAGLVY